MKYSFLLSTNTSWWLENKKCCVAACIAYSSKSPSWRCHCARWCVQSYLESCNFCSVSSLSTDMESLLRNGSCVISGTIMADISWDWWALVRKNFWVFPVLICLPVMCELFQNWSVFLALCEVSMYLECFSNPSLKGWLVFFKCMLILCVWNLSGNIQQTDWVQNWVELLILYFCWNALQILKLSVWNNCMTWEVVK